jgi:N-methylhydantoinase B
MTTGARLDDVITGEVVRSGLSGATEEASVVVVRSSHSTFIQEGADACAALLDAEARLVAQSTATSLMHAASLRCSLPALLEDVPAAAMVPGDVFALNDPYRGGIHSNDIVVVRPVFAPGAEAEGPRFFAGTLIHVADLGGNAVAGLAAVATDTFAEGLLLPPVRLVRAGNPERDVLRIIERNSRAPDKAVGDVKALIAGVNVIARRVEDLAARYGIDVVERFASEGIAQAEARMRAELAALAPGRYHGAFTIDGDGVDPDRELVVRVAVTVGGGEVEVDFAGTSEQARGSINASYSQALSGVVYAVRCFVDPTIPMNEGCFTPLRTQLPAGSLVNPTPPAACGGRLMTVAAAIEAILAALASARPDHAVGASALIHVWSLSGRDPRAPWLNLFYEFGGLGARVGADGPDATGAFFLGGRSVIPQLEPLEAQYPFVVRECRLWPDSGGAGRWRGGLGVELVIELLDDAVVTVRGARMDEPPPGTRGGHPGRGGSFSIERADGSVELLPAKCAGVEIDAGDRFVVRTSGGGGLGDPSERDPELVRADVHAGLVTPAAAARDYGLSLERVP